MPSFPPRLHVLLARTSPVALVLRRGPSRSVALVRWDRRRDTFELGQWVKHRIYERRCDISPNGEYLIYFAMNGHWSSETRGAWTAISRVPYAKAIVLLPKGDCWHGGGLWTGDRTYWLNDGYGHQVLRDDRSVRRDTSYQPPVAYGGECPHVYYNRLVRDGWTLVEQARGRDVLDRELPRGWTLRKIAHAQSNPDQGHGVYWDEHELRGPGGRVVECPDWEWAERDGARLVWATAGRLWAAPLRAGGPGDATELHDFNGMKFESIEAPY